MYLSRFDESSDPVEAQESKPVNSCSVNPSPTPASANEKVPTNCSSEGAASGFQTTFGGPLAKDGSKSASNDLSARTEVKAEPMYQLVLESEVSFPATESAR